MPGDASDLGFALFFVCACMALWVAFFPTSGFGNRADGLLRGFAVFLFLVNFAFGILFLAMTAQERKSALPEGTVPDGTVSSAVDGAP